MLKSLEELVNIIRERKNSDPEKSYTKKLLNNRKMNFEKVNEEVKELLDAIQKTKHNTGLNLNLALSYGSRKEILSAVKFLSEKILAGEK